MSSKKKTPLTLANVLPDGVLSPVEYALANGADLYPWQMEVLEAVGKGWPTALLTCNGAGKTAVVAAWAASWFFHAYPKGKLVATSGSFVQLQNQLWPNIRMRLPPGASCTNGASPCTVKLEAGGVGIGFSTNDPGKAEGWHPSLSADEDPVFILVDESKSVGEGIFQAFDRCTKRFQLYISSAGAPSGRFYDCFHKNASLYYTVKVNHAMCPHISAAKIARDRKFYGSDSPVFRSMHMAEFTSVDGRVILTPEALNKAFEIQPEANHYGEKVVFCDFAAGGDENAIGYRSGNTVKLHSAWRDHNTVQARREFLRQFATMGVRPGQVFGDADGIGNIIIADMAEEGFRINQFHGGAGARDSINYTSLISEVWIEACRDIERGKVHLGPRNEFDPLLFEQLTSRYLEYDSKGRLRLESKETMKSRGLQSPDRADAFIGAIMCGSRSTGAFTAATPSASGVSPFRQKLVKGFNSF